MLPAEPEKIIDLASLRKELQELLQLLSKKDADSDAKRRALAVYLSNLEAFTRADPQNKVHLIELTAIASSNNATQPAATIPVQDAYISIPFATEAQAREVADHFKSLIPNHRTRKIITRTKVDNSESTFFTLTCVGRTDDHKAEYIRRLHRDASVIYTPLTLITIVQTCIDHTCSNSRRSQLGILLTDLAENADVTANDLNDVLRYVHEGKQIKDIIKWTEIPNFLFNCLLKDVALDEADFEIVVKKVDEIVAEINKLSLERCLQLISALNNTNHVIYRLIMKAKPHYLTRAGSLAANFRLIADLHETAVQITTLDQDTINSKSDAIRTHFNLIREQRFHENKIISLFAVSGLGGNNFSHAVQTLNDPQLTLAYLSTIHANLSDDTLPLAGIKSTLGMRSTATFSVNHFLLMADVPVADEYFQLLYLLIFKFTIIAKQLVPADQHKALAKYFLRHLYDVVTDSAIYTANGDPVNVFKVIFDYERKDLDWGLFKRLIQNYLLLISKLLDTCPDQLEMLLPLICNADYPLYIVIGRAGDLRLADEYLTCVRRLYNLAKSAGAGDICEAISAHLKASEIGDFFTLVSSPSVGKLISLDNLQLYNDFIPIASFKDRMRRQIMRQLLTVFNPEDSPRTQLTNLHKIVSGDEHKHELHFCSVFNYGPDDPTHGYLLRLDSALNVIIEDDLTFLDCLEILARILALHATSALLPLGLAFVSSPTNAELFCTLLFKLVDNYYNYQGKNNDFHRDLKTIFHSLVSHADANGRNLFQRLAFVGTAPVGVTADEAKQIEKEETRQVNNTILNYLETIEYFQTYDCYNFEPELIAKLLDVQEGSDGQLLRSVKQDEVLYRKYVARIAGLLCASRSMAQFNSVLSQLDDDVCVALERFPFEIKGFIFKQGLYESMSLLEAGGNPRTKLGKIFQEASANAYMRACYKFYVDLQEKLQTILACYPSIYSAPDDEKTAPEGVASATEFLLKISDEETNVPLRHRLQLMSSTNGSGVSLNRFVIGMSRFYRIRPYLDDLINMADRTQITPREIFELLLQRDNNGNTLGHICVATNLSGLYLKLIHALLWNSVRRKDLIPVESLYEALSVKNNKRVACKESLPWDTTLGRFVMMYLLHHGAVLTADDVRCFKVHRRALLSIVGKLRDELAVHFLQSMLDRTTVIGRVFDIYEDLQSDLTQKAIVLMEKHHVELTAELAKAKKSGNAVLAAIVGAFARKPTPGKPDDEEDALTMEDGDTYGL